MSTDQSDAQRLLAETLVGLDTGADSASLISAIKASQNVERFAERARVEAVAELWRRGDGDGVEHVQRRRWSTAGSDRHLSYGLLAAEAKRILGKIV